MSALAAEDEAWVAATRGGNVAQYQHYLDSYPQGRYTQGARTQLANLKDETDIRALIEQYEAAYNRKDLDGMVSLWPSFPPGIQQRTRETFRTAKSVNMILTFGEPQISGASASVTCKRTKDIVGADEGGGHSQDVVTFRFSKHNERWTIDSAPH